MPPALRRPPARRPPPSPARTARSPRPATAPCPPTPRKRSLRSLPGRDPPAVDTAPVTFIMGTPTTGEVSTDFVGVVLVLDHPKFGPIVKLTHEIVKEIRCFEAEGGRAHIHFNFINPMDTSGNVISIGTKQFSFTWDLDMVQEPRWEDWLYWHRAIFLDQGNNHVDIVMAAGIDAVLGNDLVMELTRKENLHKNPKVESSQVSLSNPLKPVSISRWDSGSCSDNRPYGSSSSKEGSDSDVDIITVDEEDSASKKLKAMAIDTTATHKLKRALDSENCQQKIAKRSKIGNSAQALYSGKIDVKCGTGEYTKFDSGKSLVTQSELPVLEYDKEKPELKGPIKDFSQFEEYVREYREKYKHYCFVNKEFENTRNEFLQIRNDLDEAKNRDVEEHFIIEEVLKDMYIQKGERHKQLNKIFIGLHEELENLKETILDFSQAYAKE